MFNLVLFAFEQIIVEMQVCVFRLVFLIYVVRPQQSLHLDYLVAHLDHLLEVQTLTPVKHVSSLLHLLYILLDKGVNDLCVEIVVSAAQLFGRKKEGKKHVSWICMVLEHECHNQVDNVARERQQCGWFGL